ncbi:hypothetical protein [Modestobacter marinus]|uniref:hypothetical protein n=1 Tax=Modestobacter marinus TaxID=477641 RepID=UPI001C96BA1A|nr:hypothetical protein [Modestobacter marinus]
MPDVPPIAPGEAFARAADALAGLLAGLDGPDWQVPVLRDLDVQGLVGHLIGVEGERGRARSQTRRALRAAVNRTLLMLEEDPAGDAREVAVHGMRLSRARCWSSVRSSCGRTRTTCAPRPPAADRARRRDAAADDPVGRGRAADRGAAGRAGHRPGGRAPRPDRCRLGDVGRRGRCGSGPAVREVVLVVEAVEFCRLVADRVDPDDVAAEVEGPVEAAAVVLAGAAALALD